MKYLNISLQEGVEMATSRVARAIGIEDQVGFVKEGYPATFAVFGEGLEDVVSLIL
jgi:N-acetylglucosamine-6-phosphate deacetylase